MFFFGNKSPFFVLCSVCYKIREDNYTVLAYGCDPLKSKHAALCGSSSPVNYIPGGGDDAMRRQEQKGRASKSPWTPRASPTVWQSYWSLVDLEQAKKLIIILQVLFVNNETFNI